MSFEIHREPLYRRYYTSLLTSSCCYTIAFGFILIFLPLILAYNSTDFWIKESVIYEQPNVKYQYVTQLQLHGKRGESNMGLFYSTSSVINALHQNNLRIGVVQSAELDDNRDGRMDRLEISVQMPLSSEESVTGITALVLLQVKLNTKARYIFDAAALISHDAASPMTHLTLDGDVMLRQSWPLTAKGGYRVPYANDPLLDLNSVSVDASSIAAIMRRSAARNLSTVFHTSYALASSEASMETSSSHFFNGTITMRIPSQPVRYTPEVSVVLKNAWIQYVAFFTVVAFLLFRLNSFLFRHQLLSSHVVTDIVYEKMD